jgi:eukaryotic-like serine/threonine-protein kinase
MFTGVSPRPLRSKEGSQEMSLRTISHFEIQEQVGEGATGVVYKARDLLLDRFVALKFLSRSLLGSDEAVRRFQDEARLISALDHPNIATIHEVGQDNGQPYLVLEYLPGGALSSRIKEVKQAGTRLSLRQILRYAVQIADGLAYAHQCGIIHRDLKPGNVLCADNHRVKICDFGLAKYVDDESIGADKLKGTIPYMSPEQIKGLKADRRSDVFSFGVMLFELAAGRRPFAGSNQAAILHSIVNTPTPSLRETRPDCPLEFEQLIRRAMDKDRDRRYHSTDEIHAALCAILEDHCPTLNSHSTWVSDTSELETVVTDPSQVETIVNDPDPSPPARWVKWGAVVAGSILTVPLLVAGWPDRCLWVPAVFGECEIPAFQHVTVLSATSADEGAGTLAAGVSELVYAGLNRLAQFHPSLCVHDSPEYVFAEKANLVLDGNISVNEDSVELDMNLWSHERVPLRQVSTIASFNNSTVLQDDLTLSLADSLGLEVDADARQLLATGGTGVPRALYAYIRGLGLWKDGDYDGSIAEFEAALQEDPYYAAAYAALAEAYRTKFHHSEEDRWLEAAYKTSRSGFEKNPGNQPPEAYATLGRILADQQRYEEAIAQLRRAVELIPANPLLRESYIKALRVTGQETQAEAEARKWVEIRPDCWLANLLLADFFLNDARLDEAERYFRRVVELTPQSPDAHGNLAIVFYSQQNYQAAEASYRQALSLQPSALYYLNLGQLYIETGCYPAAEEALERSRELMSDDFLSWGNLGETYLLLPEYKHRANGLFARAKELADKEHADRPDDQQAIRMRAFYDMRLGNKAAALKTIKEALAMGPNVRTLYRAGFLYELAGERDLAIQALKQIIESDFKIREMCTHPDLISLRSDERFGRLLNGRCEDYLTRGTDVFVCPEDGRTD